MPHLRGLMLRGQERAEAGKPIEFIASTSGVKRDGKSLSQDDWVMTNYKRNPVVLWVHDYWGATMPIGRTVDLKVEDGNLIASILFDQDDEFARKVESKYRRGFLNAVSVGWEEITNDGETRNDLLDISAVPIPGDPQALMPRQRTLVRNLGNELLNAFADGDEEVLGEQRAEDDEDDADTGEGEGEGDEETPEPEVTPELVDAVTAALDYELIASLVAEMLDQETLADEVEDEDDASDEDVEDEDDEEGAGFASFGRAGAVLSKRNRDDLGKARELIKAVLDRAKKEEESDERSLSDPDLEDDEDDAEFDLAALEQFTMATAVAE